jgi:HD-GYP domain-containing protein (c-di-GMP phosphodiesterase class II)
MATSPHDASEREELIKLADQAMYTAKRLGRNQVRTACELLGQICCEALPGTSNNDQTRIEGIAEALLALLEARALALSQHARRVAALSFKLAQELELGQKEARLIGLGGLLHDLGKMTLPDECLLRCGCRGRMGQEIQARAAVIGAAILALIPELPPLPSLVRSQAEWMDGTGSPDGLKGEKIPLGARIVAVASLYDAILAERGSPIIALNELRRATPSRLDPRVVKALGRILSTSPHSACG